jgi:hypothetical protein
LALLQSLSSFMACSAKACFSDLFASGKATPLKISHYKVDDNVSHPMAVLIRRLDELVVQPMNDSDAIDPRIRAAALLELIDGVILIPFPMPRDFFVPQLLYLPDLLISADPTPVFAVYDESLSIIEAAPSIGFSFVASGRVSSEWLKMSRVPTWTILLWFQLKILDEEDANYHMSTADPELKDVRVPDVSSLSPAASSISVNGHFFFTVECPPLMDEGHYLLCTKLGFRDARGNEYEIPSRGPNSHGTTVRVSRSRSLV